MNTIFLGLKQLERELRDRNFESITAIIKEMRASAALALSTLNDMLAFDKILRNALEMEMELEKARPWPLIREVVAPMLVQVICASFLWHV